MLFLRSREAAMSKRSELQRVLDGLYANRDAITATIDLIEAQRAQKPARTRKAPAVRRAEKDAGQS